MPKWLQYLMGLVVLVLLVLTIVLWGKVGKVQRTADTVYQYIDRTDPNNVGLNLWLKNFLKDTKTTHEAFCDMINAAKRNACPKPPGGGSYPPPPPNWP